MSGGVIQTMRNAAVGRAVFAVTLIAVGISSLIKGDFAPIWQPVPKGIPGREALAYLCAFVSLACGIGLLWRRAAASAAGVLFAYLLVWLLLIKAHYVLLTPTVVAVYEDCGETAVLVAGAGVLYGWLTVGRNSPWFRFVTGETGVRTARVLYGLALIAFGLAHFAYPELTAALVPRWLPAHMVWVYFTGFTYLAAGVAMLTGVFASLAAALSAMQIGLFTLLVWLPIVAMGGDASQWGEFVISWALTAGAWVVADSYQVGLGSQRAIAPPAP